MKKKPVKKSFKMDRYQSNDYKAPFYDTLNEHYTHSNDFSETVQPEDEVFVDSKEHLRSLCEDQKISNNYICEDDFGQQSRINTCNHNKRLNDLDSKIKHCIFQNKETHLKLDDFKKTLGILFHKIGIGHEPTLDDIEANVSDGEDHIKTSSSKLDVVDSRISKCILSNKQIHLKIDSLQKLLDLILKNIENGLTEPEASPELFINTEQEVVFHFPISSVNELNKLDEQLQHNEELMANLIAKFTKIAGDSGNKSAKKVGVKIIEKIISAKLLTKFTWTGRTNGANNIKLPFITYSSIFYLCLQVISKADRSFDSYACEHFLKNNILKHSSMRLSRKFNKKLNREKSIEETWCMRSKLVVNNSTEHSQSIKIPNILEQKCDEEIVDSKANIVKLLDDQKETNNNSELLSNSFPIKCDHDSKLDIMDRKITDCIDSNTKVHSKIDNMQETLNIILNKIGKGRDFGSNPTSGPDIAPETIMEEELKLFYFPIKTVLDLQRLNRKLSTIENFEQRMIEKFISIAGDVKNISTQRYGLEVVESVVSPQLLMKYSWTGRSKSVKPKMAFMKYKYIVDFFQKIISKVDKRFTPKKCEDFLRFSVFKYINMRVARKRRKIKDPMSEFVPDHDDNKELNNSGLSIEDVPVETPENGPSYKFEHNSAIEFCEAHVES